MTRPKCCPSGSVARRHQAAGGGAGRVPRENEKTLAGCEHTYPDGRAAATGGQHQDLRICGAMLKAGRQALGLAPGPDSPCPPPTVSRPPPAGRAGRRVASPP